MAHCALFQGLMAADEKLGKTMFFPLAERMVVKFINENKVDAEAGTVHVLPFLGIIINYMYYGNSKTRYFNKHQQLTKCFGHFAQRSRLLF